MSEVKLIVDQDHFIDKDFSGIRQEMRDLHTKNYGQVNQNDLEYHDTKNEVNDGKLKELKLIFMKCPDERFKPSFFSYFLQSKVNKQHIDRWLVVYDLTCKKPHKEEVQFRNKSTEFISRDFDNFENFVMCQTSDFVTTNHNKQSLEHYCKVKLSLIVFFRHDVGLIKVSDYIVDKA